MMFVLISIITYLQILLLQQELMIVSKYKIKLMMEICIVFLVIMEKQQVMESVAIKGIFLMLMLTTVCLKDNQKIVKNQDLMVNYAMNVKKDTTDLMIFVVLMELLPICKESVLKQNTKIVLNKKVLIVLLVYKTFSSIMISVVEQETIQTLIVSSEFLIALNLMELVSSAKKVTIWTTINVVNMDTISILL